MSIVGAQTCTRTHAVEWVCVDCHLTIAGYSPEELGTEPRPYPWADDPTVEDITNGSPIEECDTPECVAAVADGSAYPGSADMPEDAHTECDHDSFSLHPCGGCGSTLAGDRYAVTLSLLDEA